MNPNESVDILLVEDNPQDAELIVRALKKKNLANQLLIMEDGAQALDYIFCQGEFAGHELLHPLKVILLDLKLPKISGLEVLRAIKSDEKTRSIPVVILTSSRQDSDIRASYDSGANSYVVKPVEFEGFIEAINQVGLYWLTVNQTSSH
jgi:two-component system, response regulator